MKICMFHLMPYRWLPQDFDKQHHSVWVDIPSRLFDPALGHVMYNQSLDELEYAAAMGYDGICVNEHHSNAYGMMPSPNLMAATLARRTRDVAIIILGNSIALYNPPIRVAEEMAMLDCLSGGRIVAGFPVGSSADTNFAYGMAPAILRDRYYEAEELIIRAWTDPEVFSFDGRFTQLRYVNVWPRPIQKPHPPVWVPGGGSIETWGWTIKKKYVYCYLSYSGYKKGKTVMDGFWRTAAEMGIEPNPYHAGFLQLVVVGGSDSEVAERYGPHIEYFFNKMLHVYPGFSDAPGYRTVETVKARLLGLTTRPFDRPPDMSWKDLVDQGAVIAGTPTSVTEQLEHMTRTLNIGHVMLLNQLGSMPHDLAMENIRLCATEVIPNLRGLWDERWQDHWWPQPLAERRQPAAV
ncbi:MAG TPA: LLM class flavin-dependent oxidoreductase [Candidatus Dormibacteraeota bacterium]|jgi:alkanesulfonate monooxygenase SsuD/methylene tetrahydromethanopterin reductase-like flavin-dependent oxidoreductase (luciferase family)|nr:LLM class flavin-dependent oxidoreductase [Candidatus Dormibacteraeota bacterium]